MCNYRKIDENIAADISGDKIMLENGENLDENGIVIDKNLNFNVFKEGKDNIDGKNIGTI